MLEQSVGEVEQLQIASTDDVAGAALLLRARLAHLRGIPARDAVLAVREQQVRHLDAVFGPFGNSGGGAVLHVVGVGDDGEDACAVVKQKLLHLSHAFP